MSTCKEALEHLRNLSTIRSRCQIIYDAGVENKLNHFQIDESKLNDVAQFVENVIMKRFPDGLETIPFHSRFRHFEPRLDRVKKMKTLLQDKNTDLTSGELKLEIARSFVDLVMVSVLLDAGAGDDWKYNEEIESENFQSSRSEGLGIASFNMFLNGSFSSDSNHELRADSVGLQQMNTASLRNGFQVSDSNPLVGVEGRTELLKGLGMALEKNPDFFLKDTVYRPGYMIDYLLAKNGISVEDIANATVENPVEFAIEDLWHIVMYGLEAIWPTDRSNLPDGTPLGDVWRHSTLPVVEGDLSSGFVPFHKLSQWLTYSLLEPLLLADIVVKGTSIMTGLPEYRNGGLFVDLEVLTLKNHENYSIHHKPDSELIIEWRALTIILLDKVYELIRSKYEMTIEQLPMVKILEGGTWTAGRVIAREKRPEKAGPPIVIISDGTVF